MIQIPLKVKVEPLVITEHERSSWTQEIKQKLEDQRLKDLKEIKTFMLLNGQLYKKLGNGVPVKCVSENLGMKILDQVHYRVCGLEGPTLARRLERLGYFWPDLKRKSAEIQRSCEQCQLVMDTRENCFVEKED